MATDDRERLDAIANAIMAPHVAQQQQASQRLRKRPGSRRWMRIAALCLFAPLLGNVLVEVARDGHMSPFHWAILIATVIAVVIAFRRKE